ncbi:MAG: alpha/beta hydrolase [Bacteroidia bacterium]
METVILTHGAIGSKEDLESLTTALRKENYNVFSFSFSGHGNLNFENKFGIEQFALELENFISENKLEKPSIIGYSMGGYVALYLALRSPSLLNKIICHATKFNWSNEVVEKETRMLNPEVMLEKIPAFAKALESKHGNSWKELVMKTAEMMREINKNNYLGPEALKAIQNKVLLGLGDKDQMVTLEETINVYRTLSNANMYVLPNTKHPIEQLDVQLFVNIVSSFLNK